MNPCGVHLRLLLGFFAMSIAHENMSMSCRKGKEFAGMGNVIKHKMPLE
jgi:hypothetical protein